MTNGIKINSLNSYIDHIREDRKSWDGASIAWFRGEPNGDTPLLPKVMRPRENGSLFDENKLLQMFRMKAPSFTQEKTPEVTQTDQWLFLAQHVGLPTRLLDWTESALIALYFAIKNNKEPIVWMISPLRLNALSVSNNERKRIIYRQVFPLTWFNPKNDKNLGIENIKGAWENNYAGIELPIAVIPTYIHPRMSAQRSVFTVHGSIRKPINEMLKDKGMGDNLLRRYEIKPSIVQDLKKDLNILGIQESTAFPDLDGLSRELSDLN
jgi:hypothetical protein